MSAGISAAIAMGILLVVLPILVWLIINCIAKHRPNSKLGKKFNDWKAKRALNSEQK
jgi:hypothetical protein